MKNFWLGFEKRAAEDKKPSLAQWVGRGTGGVVRAVDSQKVVPKETMRNVKQKVRQKADEAMSYAKQKQREFSKGMREGKKGNK